MTGDRRMVMLNEIKGAAAKTAGGAVVGGVSYVGALSISDLQIYAAIFAAIMTGLYFFAIGFHTCLKIRWDMQDRKARK